MENKLNALSELAEKLVIRIQDARDNNTISRIEIDILLDLLRQTYIAAEELKSTGVHKTGTGDSAIKQVIQEKRPDIEMKVEEAPVKEPEQVQHPVTSTSKVEEEPVVEPAPVYSEPEPEIQQAYEAPVIEKEAPVVEPVAENYEPVTDDQEQVTEDYEPVIEKQAAIPMDEVPVMSFPKVEVELTNPSVISESPAPPPVTAFRSPVVPEPEPVKETYTPPAKEVYTPPAVPVNAAQPAPEVVHTAHHTSAQHTQKQSKASSDLFANQTIADKLRNDTQSLNEKITQGRSDQSLAARLQLKPISDLRTAIGINEKFQFVNDLFEGRIDLYNDAVGELNTCGSAMIADRLVDEYKSRYNWNENAEAYGKLKTFVTRRYL